MTKVNPTGNKEYFIDGYMINVLDDMKQAIKQDWDMCVAIDGMEGSGKSLLAMQMAVYCDPTLTLGRIVFTPDDLKQAIVKAEKYQAIIFDEAFGISAR